MGNKVKFGVSKMSSNCASFAAQTEKQALCYRDEIASSEFKTQLSESALAGEQP